MKRVVFAGPALIRLASAPRRRPKAAVRWGHYQGWLETMEILADSELMAQLRQSIREMEEGKLIPWEEVEKELALKYQL